MGNLINLPNITLESLVVEEHGNSVRKSTFDSKNYLNTRLEKGEKEKSLTIRFLPMDLETGNPFVIIHTHNVKVPQDMVPKGSKPYKRYICVARTKDVDHDKFGTKCPFCEINQKAYKESENTTDPMVKKSWQEISLANKSKETVVCRCIERGKEDEGVKFWMFNLRDDKTDPYHQILKLVNLRKESAAKKGKVENILDIYNGRDFTITITDGSTSAPTIVDDSDRSPLSESEDTMRKWIFDEKKWQDVFTCKPYEYLSLVSQQKIPWFDRNSGTWVEKVEVASNKKQEAEEATNEVEKAKENLKNMVAEQPKPKNDFAAAITIDDDDMPF